MFSIGDRVVYPMHGAGIIESIEDKEFLGVVEQYYVVKMPLGDMKVMIPVKKVEHLGIREVIGSHSVNSVLDILRDQKERMTDSWNKRYRDNLERLKAGDIFEIADVVGELLYLEREKGLSAGERKMLDTAKQIMVSELLLAGATDEDELEKMFDSLSKKAST